jgi:xanthine dehydrogenase YagT iron-sulfur-binding subunit
MAKHEDDRSIPTTSLEKLSRRSFLSRAGAVGVATAAATIAMPVSAVAEGSNAQEVTMSESGEIPGTVPVTLKINGESHRLRIDPRATLLDTLRETLQLTGTKKGCDHGQCGACTVHINGRRANSCLLLAAMQQSAEITTIEGLGTPDKMHPLQAAFVEHDGYQCGYCTSGQIMSAAAMLREPCGPADSDVKEALSGNICRCGAYPNIVAAVQAVRRHA